jgi:hypothetical protein
VARVLILQKIVENFPQVSHVFVVAFGGENEFRGREHFKKIHELHAGQRRQFGDVGRHIGQDLAAKNKKQTSIY